VFLRFFRVTLINPSQSLVPGPFWPRTQLVPYPGGPRRTILPHWCLIPQFRDQSLRSLSGTCLRMPASVPPLRTYPFGGSSMRALCFPLVCRTLPPDPSHLAYGPVIASKQPPSPQAPAHATFIHLPFRLPLVPGCFGELLHALPECPPTRYGLGTPTHVVPFSSCAGSVPVRPSLHELPPLFSGQSPPNQLLRPSPPPPATPFRSREKLHRGFLSASVSSRPHLHVGSCLTAAHRRLEFTCMSSLPPLSTPHVPSRRCLAPPSFFTGAGRWKRAQSPFPS